MEKAQDFNIQKMVDNTLITTITTQDIFDAYLKELDNFIRNNIKNRQCALIMTEALMVKVKELFQGQGYDEDQTLLFVQHALQELDENKPTIH